MEAAVEEAVPAEVLTAALYTRFRSRQQHTFAEKLLSAMRKQFGGHVEARKPRMVQKLETALTPQHNRDRRPLRGGHLRCLG